MRSSSSSARYHPFVKKPSSSMSFGGTELDIDKSKRDIEKKINQEFTALLPVTIPNVNSFPRRAAFWDLPLDYLLIGKGEKSTDVPSYFQIARDYFQKFIEYQDILQPLNGKTPSEMKHALEMIEWVIHDYVKRQHKCKGPVDILLNMLSPHIERAKQATLQWEYNKFHREQVIQGLQIDMLVKELYYDLEHAKTLQNKKQLTFHIFGFRRTGWKEWQATACQEQVTLTGEPIGPTYKFVYHLDGKYQLVCNRPKWASFTLPCYT